ncbi:MAG: EAL domain-containing protein [Gammaproteobacteria bacterium]
MSALHKLRAEWVPAAIVSVVMLLAGSRLIALSMQQHAAQARESAQVVVGRYGRAIESQLQALARGAQRQSEAKAPLASVKPDRKGFWLAADGTVVKSMDSDAATVQAIVSEWASADSHQGAGTAGLLGPIRHGSQWLIGARVPVMLPAASGAPRRAGWSIAHQSVDALLSSAKLGQLVNAGYDFEVSRREPTSRPSRVVSSSNAVRLAEPVTRTIRPPAGFLQSPRGAGLTIAVRPKGGWYPASALAANAGFLAVVTWLLTFGAYDMTRDSSRLRVALAAARRQLLAVNQRLMNEIEQRQSLQKSFDHARYHDAFTGLPNRRYFMDQLERALRELRTRRRRRMAIVLVDIDRFKLINDTLGHTAGDEVMVQAARRFERATAAFECVLARWGGDQFAVLLVDVHSSDTAISVARLLRESLRVPFELRKHRVSVAASMGVTCVDSGLQRAENVLREADIALSVAKSQEGQRVVEYDPAMGGDAVGLVSLEADLHVALERDELRLLFQPIVDLRTGHIVGAEALLGWRHPVEGVLAPDKFLAIAEEAGLILPITRWIIDRVCRLAGEWRRRLPPEADFYISINLSAAALRDARFGDYVSRVLEETHTPARALRFELTESGLISNIGAAREILERLHGMGIQLMLDDFGTGYSSLAHLQVFPFDYVKIDRPFANRSGSEQADSRIMRAMVQMVSSLGLKAIAELVETAAGAHALQQIGCDFGQGFFFCEPVESEEVLQRLRNQASELAATNVEWLTASGTHDRSPTVTESAELLVAAAPDYDSPTLVEPLESVGPIDDSPTLVEPAEEVVAAAPNYDSPTLVEPLESLTASGPIDDSPTLVEPAEEVAAATPNYDSPTLTEPLESFTAGGPIDDSPTLAEPVDDSSDDSPTLVEEPAEPRRRAHRARIRPRRTG